MNKRILFLLARDRWLEAESRLLAYERRFRAKEKSANLLGQLSIVAAIGTAFAAHFQHLTLTVFVAVITALLSGIERVFNPVSEATHYWQARTEIDTIKRDLAAIVIKVQASDDPAGIAPLFDVMADRISRITIPYESLATDRTHAADSFRGTLIDNLLNPAPEFADDDTPVALAFDAPGLIAAAAPQR